MDFHPGRTVPKKAHDWIREIYTCILPIKQQEHGIISSIIRFYKHGASSYPDNHIPLLGISWFPAESRIKDISITLPTLSCKDSKTAVCFNGPGVLLHEQTAQKSLQYFQMLQFTSTILSDTCRLRVST
jgi:hypothetical protein